MIRDMLTRNLGHVCVSFNTVMKRNKSGDEAFPTQPHRTFCDEQLKNLGGISHRGASEEVEQLSLKRSEIPEPPLSAMYYARAANTSLNPTKLL